MTDVLALIPARGGSKGVPRKNLRTLAGKSLLAYAIEAAQGSASITRTVVSTEDEEIAAAARDLGCEMIRRPDALARDETPMKAVVEHALGVLQQGGYKPDVTVLLQPTSPLRSAGHIEGALALLESRGAGSVVSVGPVPGHFHPAWQFALGEKGELRRYEGGELGALPARRQDLQPTFTRNGAIYAFRTAGFLSTGSFYVDPCLAYVMPAEVSVNIDQEQDLRWAEWVLREGQKEGGS